LHAGDIVERGLRGRPVRGPAVLGLRLRRGVPGDARGHRAHGAVAEREVYDAGVPAAEVPRIGTALRGHTQVGRLAAGTHPAETGPAGTRIVAGQGLAESDGIRRAVGDRRDSGLRIGVVGALVQWVGGRQVAGVGDVVARAQLMPETVGLVPDVI